MNAPHGVAVDGFTARHPELGTKPVSTQPVISAEYFEQEREKIFKRSWLNVGRSLDIPNPGDYYTIDIDILNASFIIVRGQDDTVRAFHNACPHRGNKVASGTGNTKGFACGFHGWTFDNQGDLVFVPDEEQFFDFEKSDFCLKEVHCDTWKGFSFINPQAGEVQPLREFLGGMGDQLEAFPFEDLARVGAYRAEVAVNWKVIIDAFQESYHGAFVHKNSAAGACCTKENPYARLDSIRLHGVHRSGSAPANPNYAPGPGELKSFQYASSLWLQGGTEETDTAPEGMNPENHEQFLFDINVFHPNFFADVSNGWSFTYNFWPVAVDKTIYEVNFYMHPARTPAELIGKEYAKVSLRDTLREDLNTVESTQSALMSGVIESLNFSDQELMCRHQYKVVDDLVNG